MSTPQFGTAEYQPQGTGDQCKTCGKAISGQYFRVNGAMTCPSCAEKAAGLVPKDSATAFTRALACGAGGAVLGFILYSVVGIVTGFEIGYVSLAVGYIVARGMLLGSSGIGGRRYQIAAVVLTYFAVSLSAIPTSIYLAAKEDGSKAAQTQPAEGGQQPAPGATADSDSSASPEMGFGAAIAFLLLLGLASPFLGLSGGFSGIIGLVILFVGLRIAWTMTAGNPIQVAGPYTT